MKRLLEKGEIVQEGDYRLVRLPMGHYVVGKAPNKAVGHVITVPGAIIFREVKDEVSK